MDCLNCDHFVVDQHNSQTLTSIFTSAWDVEIFFDVSNLSSYREKDLAPADFLDSFPTTGTLL